MVLNLQNELLLNEVSEDRSEKDKQKQERYNRSMDGFTAFSTVFQSLADVRG